MAPIASKRSAELATHWIRPACRNACCLPIRNDRFAAPRLGRFSEPPPSVPPLLRLADPLTLHVANDPNDRHVLAAAVPAGAPILLTFSLRHVRAEHLAPWGITALHPQQILAESYSQISQLIL